MNRSVFSARPLQVTSLVVVAGLAGAALAGHLTAKRSESVTATPVAITAPVATKPLTWDQYTAQEACSNLRKGMNLERAGYEAGVAVAVDDRFRDTVLSMPEAEMKKQLGIALIDTCRQELEAAARREGLN